MRIGVIADTHIPKRADTVPAAVIEAFGGVDLILHAGDLVVPEVLSLLELIAPVVAVAGNNDPPELAERLGLTRELQIEGFRIGLAHGHLGKGKTTAERAISHFSGADCVVYGHSHIPYCQWHGQTLVFNPGSATDRRRQPTCSYGLLTIGSDGISGQIFDLPRG